MSLLVVTGYASLDYVLRLDGQAQGDTTTLVRHRDPRAWPRAGGCPTYVAATVQRAGQAAAPVMWLGTGAEGDPLLRALGARGVDCSGIDRLQCEASPTSTMIYQADGSCICLYDPALCGREVLGAGQGALIARATHLCISVGPPQLQRQILDLCPPGARLYWAVKNDPDAFGPDLRRDLARRADVVFCSRAERGLIGDTAAVLVETRGAEGVRVTGDGLDEVLPAERIEVHDTTGAGDTFAGGFIAAQMADGAGPVAATRAGLSAAATLLTERRKDEER